MRPVKPPPGYSAFWPFAGQYLESRFEDAWCLSADQSLLLHVGDRTVPPQLLVRLPKGANKPTPLPHGTSVLDVRLELPAEQDRVTIEGVRMMTLAAALALIARLTSSAPVWSRRVRRSGCSRTPPTSCAAC